MPARTTRNEKLDLRLTRQAKSTLQAAAAVSRRSVSEFVLESALARADEALADRRVFRLNGAQWKAFLAALDAPPRPLPRLERLLKEPGFFDAGSSRERRPKGGKTVSSAPLEDFDCGREELNRYLLRYAAQNQQAGSAQTYVGLVGETVVGYHTLAVGHVTREEAPERLTKGLARHPVPIMLLARLAVDHRWQGQGIGKALLRDAMQRTLQAADIAGIRALAVHAKDEAARNFYQKFDLLPPRPTPCTCSFC